MTCFALELDIAVSNEINQINRVKWCSKRIQRLKQVKSVVLLIWSQSSAFVKYIIKCIILRRATEATFRSTDGEYH